MKKVSYSCTECAQTYRRRSQFVLHMSCHHGGYGRLLEYKVAVKGGRVITEVIACTK